MIGLLKHVQFWGFLAVLSSCGARTTGDEGTESHWLTACATDDECAVGACWCGRCTQRCEGVANCPHPLDQCVPPGTGPFDDTCTVPQGGLCSAYDEGVLESVHALREHLATKCDAGRDTVFSVTAGMDGQTRVVDAGGGEYYLLATGASGGGLVRVATDGAVLQMLPVPSDLSPELSDLLPLPDGRVALAGSTKSFADQTGWIGVVDANWQLVWEQELDGSGAYDLVQLPGGDLVVAGPHYDGTEDEDGYPLPKQGMARFDVDGMVKWEAWTALEGYQTPVWSRVLAVAAEQPRVLAQTSNGLVLVTADDNGELSQQLLDTSLALYLSGVTALPNGRLAISSLRAPGAIVTVVEADGTVVWERSYGRETGAESSGIAYDPTREQIVVAGSYRGEDGGTQRTWMIATDLDGEQEWELTRLPQETEGVDGMVSSVSPNRGPSLHDVTVGADGTLVAPGATSFDLSFFVVGTTACE